MRRPLLSHLHGHKLFLGTGSIVCDIHLKPELLGAGKHLVLYDDGDREWLSFQSERVTWLKDEPAPPKEEPEAMLEDAPGDEEVCLLNQLSTLLFWLMPEVASLLHAYTRTHASVNDPGGCFLAL